MAIRGLVIVTLYLVRWGEPSRKASFRVDELEVQPIADFFSSCNGRLLLAGSIVLGSALVPAPESEFGAVRDVAMKGLSGTHRVQTVEWSQHAV